MLEYVTPANVVLAIGLSLLLLANCLFIKDLHKQGWDGVAVVLFYLMFISYGGFPLATILFLFFISIGFMHAGKRATLLMTALLNLSFIVQWIIWWLILRAVF